MAITLKGWKNKGGTAGRTCNCKSWKNHWLNNSGEPWPDKCSILGCTKEATAGAHIINTNVSGEKIVPACDTCNNPNNKAEFDLKEGTVFVSANKSETCKA